MKRFLIPALLICSLAFAGDNSYTVTHYRVVDGDTVEVTVDLGFNIIRKKVMVRLAQIDTPERSEIGFYVAKDALNVMLSVCKELTLIDQGTGKYGRTIGTLICDGANINHHMITEGFAVPYV